MRLNEWSEQWLGSYQICEHGVDGSTSFGHQHSQLGLYYVSRSKCYLSHSFSFPYPPC